MRLFIRLFEAIARVFASIRRSIAEGNVRAYLGQAMRKEEDIQLAFNAFIKAYDARDGTRHAIHGISPSTNIEEVNTLFKEMMLAINPNTVYPISQVVRVNGRALSLLVFMNAKNTDENLYLHYGLNKGTIYFWISPTRKFLSTYGLRTLRD